ncbi:Alpha/Beta hydrolase protein [Auriculariales sp. MPI-PUGE-AT-0066]|nr:Alpha/Beta hydrolase protein [Auriculariales sp. MPI-PUGE-AT-0066]
MSASQPDAERADVTAVGSNDEREPLLNQSERAILPERKARKWPLILAVLGTITLAAIVGGVIGEWRSHRARAVPVPRGFNREEYGPCPEDSDLECGFVSVPRNYFNSSQGRVDIYVARYRTPEPEKKLGTLFLGHGGPGGPGSQLAILFGKHISQILDGRYDIVGADNRGTVGKTRPEFSCFPTWADSQIFGANTVFRRGFNVPPDPFSEAGRSVLEQQMRELLALSEVQFKLCETAPNHEEIPFMGTPTVVRDLDYIVKALDGDDALINYWGASYGSILGQYLVNMLPHRVGKVVIDGIVRPDMWANMPPHKWLYQWLGKVEESFDFLLKQCGEVGPERCALAKFKGEGYQAIATRLNFWLDKLYYAPAPSLNPRRPGIITSAMAREATYILTNYPKAFGYFAPWFADALEGNYTHFGQQMLRKISFPSAPISGDVSRNLISCMDTVPYDPDHPETWPPVQELVDSSLDVLRDVSPRFGMSTWLYEKDGMCQYLRSVQRIPERFTGPWNATLRTPMLITSNDLDPITPLPSARWTNQQMGSSARLLVIDNTPGHTSMYTGPSLCMARALRAYYVYGTVPADKETHCENDETMFDHVDNTSPTRVTDADDQDLVDAVYGLRPLLYEFGRQGLGIP